VARDAFLNPRFGVIRQRNTHTKNTKNIKEQSARKIAYPRSLIIDVPQKENTT